MTVSFYSTPNGRKVEKIVGDKSNFTKPGERYILKRSMADGTKVKTAEGVQGFSVTVTRIVRNKSGKVLSRGDFTSKYVPEDTIYRVGPNTPVNGSVENPPEGLDRPLRT